MSPLPHPVVSPDRRNFLKTTSSVVMAGALTSSLGFPSLLTGATDKRKLKLGLIAAATYG